MRSPSFLQQDAPEDLAHAEWISCLCQAAEEETKWMYRTMEKLLKEEGEGKLGGARLLGND